MPQAVAHLRRIAAAVLEQDRRAAEALGQARQQIGVIGLEPGERGRLGVVGADQPA
jgi:hypothetical protein